MTSQALRYLPVNLANIFISFATITILTRLLSAEEFGRYALVIAAMNFVHMGVFTWLEASMARFYAREDKEGELSTHHSTLYISALGVMSFALPLCVLVIFILPISAALKSLFCFALVKMGLHVFYGLNMEAHKAAQRIGRYSLIHAGQIILGFSVGILLILLTPLREAGPIIGMAIGIGIALLIDAPRLKHLLSHKHFDKTILREYFKFGGPIGLTLILAYALETGDLFAIKYFMGDGDVGAYNAGYNLANNMIDYLFVWLSMAIMPVAITAYEHKGVEHSKGIISRFGGNLVILLVPASIGLGLIANDIGFLFGESVRDQAVKIIPWIAIAALMNGFVNLYVHQAYVLSKKLNILARLMIIPVMVNIILNIIFIPIYGLVGAIGATLAAYVTALIVSIIGARKYYPLPLLFSPLIKCGLAAFIMWIVIYHLPFDIITLDWVRMMLKIGVSILIYAVCIWILNPENVRRQAVEFFKKKKA